MLVAGGRTQRQYIPSSNLYGRIQLKLKGMVAITDLFSNKIFAGNVGSASSDLGVIEKDMERDMFIGRFFIHYPAKQTMMLDALNFS